MPMPKNMRQLTTQQVFRQVERRFHSRDSKRQPLPNFFCFCFATAILQNLGHVIGNWKGEFKTFPSVYCKSPNILNFQLVKTKIYCCQLATAEHAGQNKPQWENNCDSFLQCFYKSIEGKSGICLLLAMSIDGAWMVNLMIIYIEKTIPKLWILTTLSEK